MAFLCLTEPHTRLGNLSLIALPAKTQDSRQATRLRRCKLLPPRGRLRSGPATLVQNFGRMGLPPALKSRWRIAHQRIPEQLPQLLDLVFNPDRAHLRLLGLLLLIRGLPLAFLPLAGCFSSLAFPLDLSCLLLLSTS